VRPSSNALERFAQATRTRLRIVFDLTPHADSYAPVPPVRFFCAIAVVSNCKFLMALDCEVVTQTFTNWNQMASLLRRIDGLRLAA
jgi:hypothetical protein